MTFSTLSSWSWALSELFASKLKALNLQPYVPVGEPVVTVTDYPDRRATMRVRIEFDIERDPHAR